MVDAAIDPYLVHIEQVPELLDLTEGLSEENGILVYDAAKLRRVAKNEHWFEGDPRAALLAVFTLTVEALPDEAATCKDELQIGTIGADETE